MPVTKYSKKAEVVDAVQYNGTNHQEIVEFTSGVATYENEVLTLNEAGGQIVQEGWWVLKDFGGICSVFPPSFLDYYRPGGGP